MIIDVKITSIIYLFSIGFFMSYLYSGTNDNSKKNVEDYLSGMPDSTKATVLVNYLDRQNNLITDTLVKWYVNKLGNSNFYVIKTKGLLKGERCDTINTQYMLKYEESCCYSHEKNMFCILSKCQYPRIRYSYFFIHRYLITDSFLIKENISLNLKNDIPELSQIDFVFENDSIKLIWENYNEYNFTKLDYKLIFDFDTTELMNVIRKHKIPTEYIGISDSIKDTLRI